MSIPQQSNGSLHLPANCQSFVLVRCEGNNNIYWSFVRFRKSRHNGNGNNIKQANHFDTYKTTCCLVIRYLNRGYGSSKTIFSFMFLTFFFLF